MMSGKKVDATAQKAGNGCAVVFIIFGLWYWLFSDGATNKPDAVVANIICQTYVTDRLTSPASADFPWTAQTSYTHKDDVTFTIRSYVDSQNGFGAILRTSFICKIQYIEGDMYSSDSWEIINLDFE